MKYNIYKVSKLSPSERDVRKIVAALTKEKSNLVGKKNRKLITADEFKELNDFITSAIASLNADPKFAESHAREIFNEMQIEVRRFAEPLINKASMEITAEALTQLERRYKSKGLTSADIQSMLGVSVRKAAATEQVDDDDDDGVKELEKARMDPINRRLSELGFRSIYHYLGVSQDVPQSRFSSLLKSKYQDSTNDTNRTARKDVEHHLLGSVQDMANDESIRKSYDKALRNQGFETTADQMSILASAGQLFIDPDRYRTLLESCLRSGLDEKLARSLMARKARQLGMTFDDGSSSSSTVMCRFCASLNDQGAVRCRSCGMPMQIKCPKCGTLSAHDHLSCINCGFPIRGMKLAVDAVADARRAVGTNDIARARRLLDEASGDWPGYEGIKEVEKLISGRQNEISDKIDTVKKLCREKNYYAAQAYINILGTDPASASLRTEIQNGVSMADGFVRKAMASTDASEKLDCFLAAVASAADCKTAVNALRSIVLPHPASVSVSTNGHNICIKWPKVSSKVIEYKVVRKEGVGPRSHTDGTVVGTTANDSIQDSGLKGGVSYFYAVFGCYGGQVSPGSAVTANPVMVAPPLSASDIMVNINESSIEFSWKRQQGLVGMEVECITTGKRSMVSGTSFTETGLTRGRMYDFAFTAVHEDITRRRQKSNTISLRLSPQAKPKPVKINFRAFDEYAELSWPAPAVGEVQIYLSDKPFKHNPNDLVTPDAIKGTRLRFGGNACTINKDFSGVRYVLPVTMSNGIGIVGEGCVIESVVKPKGVKVGKSSSDILVKWTPSAGADIRVEWRLDGGSVRREDIRQTTSGQSEYLISVPKGSRSAEVRVYSIVSSPGGFLISQPEKFTISLESVKVELLGLRRLKRYGFLSTDNYVLSLRTNGHLPSDLSVLAREDIPPLDLVNSFVAARINRNQLQPGVDLEVTITYKRQTDKPLYFRVVASDRTATGQVSVQPEMLSN